MKRLGLFGGTFDPIHCGHLIIAEEARVRLALDAVCFIPTGQPPHKVGRLVSPATDRLEMVRLAIAGNPAFRLSSIEIERDGPSYTVDTLNAVRQDVGAHCELFFIVGGDALADLLTWRAPERLLELATLVVVSRPNVVPPRLTDLTSRLPALATRLIRLAGPQFAVSGTEIRQRVSQGLPIRYQVPETVWTYILERTLYQA